LIKTEAYTKPTNV